MDIRPRAPASEPAADRPATAEQRLTSALSGARLHVEVTVPRTDVRAKLRRLSRREEQEVSLELAAWHAAATKERGPLPELRQEIGKHESVLILARAVRDHVAVDRPLGTVDEWGEADEAQLAGLMTAYYDVVARTEPWPGELTPAERAELAAAVQRRDRATLVALGAARLAAWIAEGAPRATADVAPG